MAESVADTWEDLEESGELDVKLNSLVLSNTADEERKVCHSNGPITRMSDEDMGRSTYQPPVRILKREPATSTTNANNCRVPSKPIRTLQEREAAYAEARLRILGSATPPNVEDSSEDGIGVSDLNPPRNFRSSMPSSNDLLLPSCDVIRQPRGPDGTSGFSVQR